MIMVAYVVYRDFTTFLILPFTESLLSPGGLYFLLLVLFAAVSTVLSFTTRRPIAASLAAVVWTAALCFWVLSSSDRHAELGRGSIGRREILQLAGRTVSID